MKRKTRDVLFYGLLLLGFALLLVLEWQKTVFLSREPYGQMCYDILSRFLAALVCVALLCRFSLGHLFVFSKPLLRPLLAVLPCFAIAVNNFPFLSVLLGEATMGTAASDYLMYALYCFAVGLFEELAFRGCVFSVVLERTHKIRSSPLRVFVACVLSSALFGLVHIVNLFVGASPLYVLLQVCYSFLIGSMCAIMMVKTSNIWYGVLLHALYNFAGGIVPEFGKGTLWTTPTVILTAVVAVIIACYVVFLLFRIRSEEIDRMLKGKRAEGASV